MCYFCGDSTLGIRRMEDCDRDYRIMAKWLSDPMVLQYYEGLTNPFDLDRVMEKYSPRVLGAEKLIPCIIEIQGAPAGYIQYYPIESEEDSDFRNEIPIDYSKRNFGIDLFIAHDAYRSKGYGTGVLSLLLAYLYRHEQADKVYIDPQTWNERALKCYAKCGFKPIKVLEKRELHDGELKDNLIMVHSKDDDIPDVVPHAKQALEP